MQNYSKMIFLSLFLLLPISSFPLSSLAACDYIISVPKEDKEKRSFLLQKGSQKRLITEAYTTHYHAYECRGSHFYWIQNKKYSPPSLLQKISSLKDPSQTLITCNSIDFRMHPKHQHIAIICGETPVIVDLQKNKILALFPTYKEITLEQLNNERSDDDGVTLIGWYGDQFFYGKGSVGGWGGLCRYKIVDQKPNCEDVPFNGERSFAISPDGQYAIYSDRLIPIEVGPEPPTMKIFIYEFKTKKNKELGSYKAQPAYFFWEENSVTAVKAHFSKKGPFVKPDEIHQWTWDELKKKLN